MDLTESIAPKSDQQNYDDYLAGPRTVTITAVHVVQGEQPVVVELAEYPGRPFKPNKSMRRVLAKAWGPDSDVWVGRGLTLFGNPSVSYGGKAVGGIEIAAMSHIDKAFTLPKRVSQKKSVPHHVDVLAEPVTEPWRAQWQAIANTLTDAGYSGDGQALLATAGQVIGTQWDHPNKISAEDAQKILAAVRENENEEGK